MLQLRCPYCGSTDGCCTTISSVSPSSPFVKECKSCGRIVLEHRCDVQEMFFERAQDTPLCIVTPDFSNNDEYRTPPLEDDPFESIGFITAFSTWSMEPAPLFTTTTSGFCGYLAELERVLLDPVSSAAAPSVNNSIGGVATVPTGSNTSMVDNLRAYFQILEVSSLLGLDRDISDHAVQLFRDCSSAAYMRNRNVEALATAALVQASREAKEARTLQEISTAASVSQKEIHRYLKILTDALQLSQPIDSNSISVYMPRFCSILELEKSTQDLATHIGDVVMNKSFCTRRNPISISAAAIYLSCQLEDKRKTQTEICKATALTEVTLRKVYKELLENINDLLPANYTPAVPLEKAFPISGSGLSRVPATRTTASGGLDSSTHPLPDVSSTKSNIGMMDSPSLSKVRLGGSESSPVLGTSSSLAASSDVAAEKSGMSKSCLRKYTMVSSNDTSMVAALPSNSGATNAPLVGKSIPPGRAGIEWERKAEDSSEVKLSTPIPDSVCHQFNFFEHRHPDASHSPLLAQAAYGSSTPQVTDNLDSSAVFGRKDEQFAGVSPAVMRDGLAAMSLPFTASASAGEELVKDNLHDRLARDKGKWLDEGRLDNKGDAGSSLVLQGAPGYAFGCSIKASTSTRSPVSHGLPKGLWDLNLAGSTPEDFVLSQNLQAQCEGLRQDLPPGREGISASDREGTHETIPVNFPYLSARDLKLPVKLPVRSLAPAPSCNAKQASSHPSFWQPPRVYFSSADSISLTGEGNSNVTDLPVKVAGLVDIIGNESEPVSYSSGKVTTTSRSVTANLLTKLRTENNSEKKASSTVDESILHRSNDSSF